MISNMHKIRYVQLILLVAISSVNSLVQAQTVFKIASIAPENSSWVMHMRKGAAEVEHRTEGRVKFKFYTGGVQGTDNQVRRKMRIGQLHGSTFTAGALRHFQPDIQIYGQPLVFNSWEEIKFVRQHMDEKLRALIEESGYVNFGIAGGGFAYIMSNRPVRNQNDMTGMKIWIPEGDIATYESSKALGIAPVTLPVTAVLTGLQTELVDTVMGPAVGAIVLQWHTAVKYITDLPIAYVYAMLVIDAKAFNLISVEDQLVVRKVMEDVYKVFDQEGTTKDKEAFQALLDDGLELVPVEASEAQEWTRRVSDSNRQIAKDIGLNPTLVDEMNCYLSAYRSNTSSADCAQ
jgi:TRAP-type C4-dicarboxylate transport system substrate-binding protein